MSESEKYETPSTQAIESGLHENEDKSKVEKLSYENAMEKYATGRYQVVIFCEYFLYICDIL